MKNTGTLAVSLPSDREVQMVRIFDAPRDLVYDAFRRPEILKRWFGPRGFSLAVCDVDWRVGGGFRFVLRKDGGRDVGMRGRYVELNEPEHSVHMESFDDFPGESKVTALFTESAGKTTMTVTVEYPSKEVRDAVVQSGMEHGAAESYDRLAELLAERSA